MNGQLSLAYKVSRIYITVASCADSVRVVTSTLAPLEDAMVRFGAIEQDASPTKDDLGMYKKRVIICQVNTEPQQQDEKNKRKQCVSKDTSMQVARYATSHPHQYSLNRYLAFATSNSSSGVSLIISSSWPGVKTLQ